MSNFPRRCYVDKLTPAELAVRAAIHKVESVGADPLLTDVVVLLNEAAAKLADFVDAKDAKNDNAYASHRYDFNLPVADFIKQMRADGQTDDTINHALDQRLKHLSGAQ